jgi:mannose-6-phosphate isomerase-like protein (cupin superfamily)
VNIDQNQAAVGQIISKVWGNTRCLVRGHGFEVHYLNINGGGYCSRHRHRAKWNQFFVVRGLLRVRFFRADGSEGHCHTLSAGSILDVPPGTLHRFEASETSEAIETYWTDPVDPDDIDRLDEGGLIPQ